MSRSARGSSVRLARPCSRSASEIALTHHERWDGRGYLAGLSGEDIPLAGRITAVADVFDALTHSRPYKDAWEPDRALAVITSQAGLQFDPRAVEAFLALDLESLPGRHVVRDAAPPAAWAPPGGARTRGGAISGS